MTAFTDDLLDAPTVDPKLAEGLVRRVVGRIQRMVDHGILSSDSLEVRSAVTSDAAFFTHSPYASATRRGPFRRVPGSLFARSIQLGLAVAPSLPHRLQRIRGAKRRHQDQRLRPRPFGKNSGPGSGGT